MKERIQHEDSQYRHVDFRYDSRGKVHGHMAFPHDFIKAKSKEDVEHILEHFGHHAVWWTQIPSTTFARRNFVEKVRPAMRFYCQKYSVPIPKWLEDDKQFEDMPPSKKKELFGTDELCIVKWRKNNPPPMLPEKDPAQQQQPQKPKPPGGK